MRLTNHIHTAKSSAKHRQKLRDEQLARSSGGYRVMLSRLGLTQAEAAKALGIHERTSRRYALGECPVPQTVQKLLNLLVEEHDRKKVNP